MSYPTTSWPRASSIGTRTEPMYPRLPVTNIFITLFYLTYLDHVTERVFEIFNDHVENDCMHSFYHFILALWRRDENFCVRKFVEPATVKTRHTYNRHVACLGKFYCL